MNKSTLDSIDLVNNFPATMRRIMIPVGQAFRPHLARSHSGNLSSSTSRTSSSHSPTSGLHSYRTHRGSIKTQLFLPRILAAPHRFEIHICQQPKSHEQADMPHPSATALWRLFKETNRRTFDDILATKRLGRKLRHGHGFESVRSW